jgi:gluconolactonase
MFFLGNAPIKQTATVWSRLPDAFRTPGVHTPWADANKLGQPTDSFLEGPLFDGHGNLYVTDIPFGRVFRIDAEGHWTLIAQYDGEPNGMKWLRAPSAGGGVLLITDYRNGLMTLDVATGQVQRFLDRRNSESFKGVNDLTFDSRGNLYFTDQGQTGLHDPSGRVFRLDVDGRLTVLMDNIPSPNGIVLSPDEKVLFVGVTRGNEIWRAPLMADGSAVKVGRFFSSHGPSGPDGLAMDVEGNLVIANPGLGCVWLINPRGEPVGVWESPFDNGAGNALTNIAFGGPDNKTLFCTESESGSILIAKLPNAGMPVLPGRV